MFRVFAETTIDRPADEVFATIADFENDLHWCPEVAEIERTSAGELGVGSTYRTIAGPKLMRAPGTYEIVAYDPPASIAWVQRQKGVTAKGSYVVEAVGESTRLRYEMFGEVEGLASRPMEFFASLFSNRIRAPRMLRRLKRYLEGTSTA